MQAKQHWEQVYQNKTEQSVSWYQPHAELSLKLIERTGANNKSRIVDVGGGASTLVDDLLAAGFNDVTVLDLSLAALQAAKQRLGALSDKVRWIDADVTKADLPARGFDVWHDRAVFHFLTEAADRAAYLAQVMRAVKPGGHVIVATFGPHGPLRCSGLPVMRYSPNALHDEFGAAFRLVEHNEEEHYTPGGAMQHFIYCHCLKLN
jgi:ubiquinone/menaquinone biosynthesis C-methylase UbiE